MMSLIGLILVEVAVANKANYCLLEAVSPVIFFPV